MKKIILGILAVTLFSPQLISAKEFDVEKFEKVAEEVKYYKTVSKNSVSFYENTINDNNISETVEISKEEFDSVKPGENMINGPGYTNTDYKSLTTTIYSNGSKYRYSATMNWKIFPSVRSYDVLAIGHLSNVKYSSNLNFSQYYCTTGGGCRTLTSYYSKITSTGCGAAFKVPTGSLTKLSQTLTFDVIKNTNATVTSQSAYGDYSHATSSVTSDKAQSYNIGTSGISFYNGVGSSYDNIVPAVATWTGSW